MDRQAKANQVFGEYTHAIEKVDNTQAGVINAQHQLIGAQQDLINVINPS
jgi:hypothetical protein